MTFGKPSIFIKDVLTQIFDRNGGATPFSLLFCSFDKERRRGGDIIKVEDAIIPTADRLKSFKKEHPSLTPIKSTNPSHQENNTINIFLHKNNKYIKVHVDLMLEFNGKTIVW